MPCPRLENPLDPTPDDLRRWAYTPDADYPDEMPQDWDLMVADIEKAEQLVELASAMDCPNRTFFLGCLYILAGDCVRLVHHRHEIPRLRNVFKCVRPDAPADVRRWVERSNRLLDHPEEFEYQGWGWGDLARGEPGA